VHVREDPQGESSRRLDSLEYEREPPSVGLSRGRPLPDSDETWLELYSEMDVMPLIGGIMNEAT